MKELQNGRGQLGMFITVIARDYGRLEMLSFPFFVTQFRTQSATFTSERVMHGEFRININVRCVFNAISSYVYYHAPKMKTDYT